MSLNHQYRNPASGILRRVRGFTLLEVLIALLVLSIGLLGVAGMQMLGLRANQNAYLRSQATVLASDIVDRMRANPDGVIAGSYNAIDTDVPPSDPNCVGTAAGCNAAQLASNDIREWSRYFNNVDGIVGYVPMLPSASGTVTVAGSVFTVTINWLEMLDDGSNNQVMALNFRL